MGKSQMLLSANQVASRSVYVGGNTASSTGLTVSLTKERGGDMGIEAGESHKKEITTTNHIPY